MFFGIRVREFKSKIKMAIPNSKLSPVQTSERNLTLC